MSEKEPIISTETSSRELVTDHNVVVQDIDDGRKREMLTLNDEGELVMSGRGQDLSIKPIELPARMPRSDEASKITESSTPLNTLQI